MGLVDRFGPQFSQREQRAIRRFLFIIEETLAKEEAKARALAPLSIPGWSDKVLLSVKARRNFLNMQRQYVTMARKPKKISPKGSRAARARVEKGVHSWQRR